MRIAVLGLLLANLMLFAWSQWVAPAPQPAPVAVEAANPGAAGAAAKRILLASERPPAPAPPVVATVPGTEDGAVMAADGLAAMPVDGLPASSAGETGLAAVGAPPAPGAATASAAVSVGPMTVASTRGAAAAGAVPPVAPALDRRCVSMGPFADLELIAQATAMLKQDGYEPRQRPARGPVPDGHMVMIGPLKGEADQVRVVGRLNRGGLDDAFALPKLEDGYAVSVGLFSQRARAERRVLAVERMGLKASVVDRTRPGTVYWVDFDLKTAAGDAGALDPLLKASDPSQKWQVVPCPPSRPVG